MYVTVKEEVKDKVLEMVQLFHKDEIELQAKSSSYPLEMFIDHVGWLIGWKAELRIGRRLSVESVEAFGFLVDLLEYTKRELVL